MKIKNKYVFLGEVNSINIELIVKSFNQLKHKINYIIIGDIKDIIQGLNLLKSKLPIKEILDPLNFNDLNHDKLNIYNITSEKKKIDKLLHQIEICNLLANQTQNDLVTMPINKIIFKNHINFIGLTEYLANINNTKTLMLMSGENFSGIPITTHINLNNVYSNLKNKLNNFFKVFNNLKKLNQFSYFKEFVFLCPNPHCGENGHLGMEDIIFRKIIKKNFKKNFKITPADSAFFKPKKNSLFISLYHDQILIPFKILNHSSFNLTVGLKYRRISPSHGIAKDIIGKGIANNTSYLKCMQI